MVFGGGYRLRLGRVRSDFFSVAGAVTPYIGGHDFAYEWVSYFGDERVGRLGGHKGPPL